MLQNSVTNSAWTLFLVQPRPEYRPTVVVVTYLVVDAGYGLLGSLFVVLTSQHSRPVAYWSFCTLVCCSVSVIVCSDDVHCLVIVLSFSFVSYSCYINSRVLYLSLHRLALIWSHIIMHKLNRAGHILSALLRMILVTYAVFSELVVEDFYWCLK